MESCVIQENDFRGNIELNSQRRHSFYSYSLWRARSGEHLFDGAAGDLTEAMETMRAHIRYLSTPGGVSTRE
jgi:hypothetical protein